MRYISRPILFKSIKEMPMADRPREKMASNGASSLSDLELLCILLGRGSKNHPVHEIAQDILDCLEISKSITSGDLSNIPGLGKAQSSILVASLELGRRFQSSHGSFIKDSSDVYKYISHYGDRQQEHFIVVLLNGAMEMVGSKVITIGLVNKTLVHPREVFSYAIENRATSIIICHNHPSGNLEPSEDDLDVTSRIRKAGDILGIQVLDHLIFSDTGYRSLRETGEYYFS